MDVRHGRGRRAVLQRRARHERAGLGVRIDSGHRQPARARWTSSKGRDRIPAVEWTECAGRRRIEPGHRSGRTPTSSTRMGSTGTSRARTWRSAALRRRRRPGAGAARRAGVTNIRPAAAVADAELRAQWMAPIIVSPHDPSTIYAGYQFVMRSTNRGDTWETDQQGSVGKRSVADAAEELERDSLPDDRCAGGVAEGEGIALRRHRRWPAALTRDDGETLDGSDGGPANAKVDLAGRAVAARRGNRLRTAARPRRRRLWSSTSTNRPTTAGRSPASPATFLPAR